ncbi:MAG: hemin ABC transporter substrate-binding protein [Pseudolabrys sp.]|nr:hemin ABC transporter substrate-binding protein [Pseudolabrys sp.]
MKYSRLTNMKRIRTRDLRWKKMSIVAAFALTMSTAMPATAEDATSRIVSIGGAVTEILYALGKDKNIVGVDTSSLYPKRATAKPSVGYMRQLSAEGVLGLNPTLILAIEGAGPKETLGVLKATHIPMVVVPDSYSGEGIAEKIKAVAAAADAPARGQCLIGQVRADLEALKTFKAGIGKPKRVLFVLSFVNGRAMAGGTKTAADGIIQLAGAVNAITDYEGYRPINDEAVIAAKPDVVLTMERGGPGTVTSESVFAHPAFAGTPAAAKRAFVSMEGLYLLGFGPRSARAARDLAVSLYPDLTSEPLPSERRTASHSCPE